MIPILNKSIFFSMDRRLQVVNEPLTHRRIRWRRSKYFAKGLELVLQWKVVSNASINTSARLIMNISKYVFVSINYVLTLVLLQRTSMGFLKEDTMKECDICGNILVFKMGFMGGSMYWCIQCESTYFFPGDIDVSCCHSVDH